jgi:hypothetical protein
MSLSAHDIPKLKLFNRSRTPSPEPQLAAQPVPPTPRRLVILVLGLKPHRKIWTSSQRPSESVINYQLLNGCPAVVLPVKLGAPLLAWDTLTLEQLWKVELPGEGGKSANGKFEGIVNVLYEYMDMCVDWPRIVVPVAGEDISGDKGEDKGEAKGTDEDNEKSYVRGALELVVAAAVRSGESKEVKKEIDKERSGIAMWRIP